MNLEIIMQVQELFQMIDCETVSLLYSFPFWLTDGMLL